MSKTCNSCNKDFDTFGPLCLSCTEASWKARENQQLGAELLRPSIVAELANPDTLSPLEAAQVDLNHGYFVLNTIINDEQGNERLDWIARVTQHRAELRKLQQQLRVKEIAAKRVAAEYSIKIVAEMSSEDRLRIQRESVVLNYLPSQKREAALEVKTAKIVNKAVQSAIDQLLKLGISEDSDQIKALRTKL
jgi:hypothetical protein